jgi:2-polyprenyl-3-methyl-5-hydroxy-6-metoxy-1,4-benzoquinol methylase
MELAEESGSERMQQLVAKYNHLISETAWSNYTLRGIQHLGPALKLLQVVGIGRMLDVGCGYGILTAIMAEYIGVKEAWGIDIDETRVMHARERLPYKLTVEHADFLKSNNLQPNYFDLVTCMGALEHFSEWDGFLENVNKVGRGSFYMLLSLPNLGSWVNRLSLVCGYQPRDLEISERKLYGTLHGDTVITHHVKLATVKALVEFIEDSGFVLLRIFPLYDRRARSVNIIDGLLKPFPSLARRVTILAKRKP